MIDYFNISVVVARAVALGKEVRVEQEKERYSYSRTPMKVKFGKHSTEFTVHYEARNKRLVFKGCPASFLQGHNGIGSNDFRGLVEVVVPLVLAASRIKYDDAMRAAIEIGDYIVHEVHIAELHKMPHRSIGDFCDNIRKHAPRAVGATTLETGKGIGVRLFPHSRSRRVLIYDKLNYFLDKPKKHLARLVGFLPKGDEYRAQLVDSFKQMKKYLRGGVRIETRLKDSLKTLKLNKGSDWKKGTARKVHLQTLRTMPLGNVPAALEDAGVISKITDEKLRTSVQLWMAGGDVRSSFNSRATYHRYRRKALDELGIDFSKRPTQGEHDWNTIIDDASIIPLPEWAKKSGFVFLPKWRSSGDRRAITQFERAWFKR